MEGRIVVDGVLASCYASTYHDLAYIGMVALQSFPKVMEWIFGDDTGFQVYVSSAMKLGKLMLPDGHYFIY